MNNTKQPWARKYYERVRTMVKISRLEEKRSVALRQATLKEGVINLAQPRTQAPAWVLEGLCEYESFYNYAREAFVGPLAEGLLMADMHYYVGLTQEEIGYELYYHRCTVSQRISRLFECLDSIGQEETLRRIREGNKLV